MINRNELALLMKERIITGLKRAAIKKPSKWAETYREMPKGLWSFKHYPWLREMHDSKAEYNVGQKSAQMGFTETLLNLAFYAIDILGKDCLYVLPNKNPDASDFSSGRFAPALELSKHLKQLFTDTDNVGHKRAGAANLYVRGSQSRSGLKSIPISYLFLDEVAEFEQDNIPLAFERTSGQFEKLIWLISTPTIEDFGISKYYADTDKRHFFFKCPGCSQQIELKFPESLVVTADSEFDPNVENSYLRCYQCDPKLSHELKQDWLSTGVWVPTVGQRSKAGFTVSQLYSPTIHPATLARHYLKSTYDVPTEVEFYNSKLGLTHEPKGARVSDADLDECILKGAKNRTKDPYRSGQLHTMGIDVGNQIIHYEIARWKIDLTLYNGDVSNCAKPVVVKFGKVRTFTELDALMSEFNVLSCVIDANPERRSAAEFAKRHFGRVKLCFFGVNIRGRAIQQSKIETADAPIIIVDRSSWLDQALGRFINKTISLPTDTDLEYREQVKTPVKTYKKDADGNPVARYLTAEGKNDHYAFSRCYNEIALVFAAGLNVSQDIQ